jgi:hypothetical protein
MPRVEVTGAACFVWKGVVVCPGTVLECSVAEAHLIVNGWGQGRYADGDPAPTRPGMVVNEDPIAEHRDPVSAKPTRRARK